MEGTLIIGQSYFIKSDGAVVLLPTHAIHPSITGAQLAVIEEEEAAMWARVRARAAVASTGK